VGLLDLVTLKGTGTRAVGEVVAQVSGEVNAERSGTALPPLTGFENHGGCTTLAPDATPLARVLRGVGNGDGSATEGAIDGRVLGTYLHGPVLARNPALADLLLGWALQVDELAPLDDRAHEALRQERLAAAGVSVRAGGAASPRRGLRGRTLRRSK
jgi:lipid II isoglutaminyl synthase (glutamine-hydrolysing)